MYSSINVPDYHLIVIIFVRAICEAFVVVEEENEENRKRRRERYPGYDVDSLCHSDRMGGLLLPHLQYTCLLKVRLF